MTQPNGYVQMPGGYTPNPPVGTPGYPQQQAPTQPQQQGVPQGMMQQAPQAQLPQWGQQTQGGAPQEGFGPPSFPAPFRMPQPFQGQPQFQQQPQQGQPQQQQPSPQQPNLDPNTRLTGAGIPTELQGKTIAEALQIYGGMRNVMLQQTTPRQQAPAQPSTQQPQGAPTQDPGGWDWRNPQAGIARVVQEQLAPVVASLQPVVMQSNLQQVNAARNVVAAQIPNFASIEPQVLERLRGADPQQLMNPDMWRVAAESVVGQMALQGRLPAAPQQTQQQTQRFNPWLQPAQNVQPGQQPMPNLNGFFSEQPNSGAPNAAPQQLTPTQQWAAQQMGMAPDLYAAWAAGVPTGGPR